jgi:hypothetical protein
MAAALNQNFQFKTAFRWLRRADAEMCAPLLDDALSRKSTSLAVCPFPRTIDAVPDAPRLAKRKGNFKFWPGFFAWMNLQQHPEKTKGKARVGQKQAKLKSAIFFGRTYEPPYSID